MMNRLSAWKFITLMVTITAVWSCGNKPDMSLVEKDLDSFKAFKSKIPKDDRGLYIVNGDTPVNGEQELLSYYKHVQKHIKASPNARLPSEFKWNSPDKLILHQTWYGTDAIWDQSEKLDLSYCIGNQFGSKKEQVIQSMREAAEAWEAATHVKFVYKSNEDENCTIHNDDVVFNVDQTSAGIYLASAFFPNYQRSQRVVSIDKLSFSVKDPLTLTGILRHELGHVLGFRHEHTRPDTGVCFENNYWRPLTDYDPYSVMHYPQCNGEGDFSLILTDKDKAGSKKVYGPPI